MNLLQAMMIYMTLTFTSAVQAAPNDLMVTPEPAATAYVEVVTVPPTEPAAQETETAPAQTLSPTETPSPTPTQTPDPIPTPAPVLTLEPTARPTPDITPSDAYKTLKEGDKGASVKAMQERLIELGYLEGPADGSFGTKTKGAIMRFQSNNGLSRDGIAGKRTLTVLFEYDGVAYATGYVTPEP